ncbi:MAG: OB-fold-containig protein [Pseudomonadota bacterium]
MLSFLFASEMVPFSAAILFLAALVCLELIALLIGGSLFGADLDAPDASGADFPDSELDAVDMSEGTGSGGGGVLSWLGLGEVPLMLWLAGLAASFGLVGYGLQSASLAVFGGLMPVGMAVAVALVPGVIGGRICARLIGRLVPKTETSAVSRRHLGGRRGVITQGTAAKDRPAECRVTDRTGATQYIRVVPQDDGITIPEGTDVIVLRPRAGIYPVIPFGAD